MRVTTSELLEIYDTDMDEPSLLAFIRSAHSFINSVVQPEALLSEDELFQLELWTAAHFACMRDPVALRSKMGDADAWFFPVSVTTAWGQGLKLTIYGQQAIVMDRTGKLAASSLMKGSFRASPREDSDRYTRGLTKS